MRGSIMVTSMVSIIMVCSMVVVGEVTLTGPHSGQVGGPGELDLLEMMDDEFRDLLLYQIVCFLASQDALEVMGVTD